MKLSVLLIPRVYVKTTLLGYRDPNLQNSGA